MRRFFHFLPLLLPAFSVFAVSAANVPNVSQIPSDSTLIRQASEILARFAKQQHASQGFSLKFESRAEGADGTLLSGVKGSLLASDSGRFRLENGGGMVVCDGRTLWQYVPDNKQVIVRNASGTEEAGGMLLHFLQARIVRAERNHDGSVKILLDPGSVDQDLDSLILNVNMDTPALLSMETQDPAGNRITYIVKSLRYDVRPNPKDFTFRTPPGVEVVDMR